MDCDIGAFQSDATTSAGSASLSPSPTDSEVFDDDASSDTAEDQEEDEDGQPSLKKLRFMLGPMALVLWMAGTCCTDFAAYGDKLGECGPMMVPWLVWISEILTDLPDVVIFEITAIGTCKFLASYIGIYYDVCEWIHHPYLFGWPCKRPRRLAVATRRSSVRFTGSEREFKDCTLTCLISEQFDDSIMRQ